MIVFEPVQAAIWHCLNHYFYSDAIFLAERLYAEVETDEALYLLATCYYRSGDTSMAYSTLKKRDCQSPQSKYLLAKCCVDLQKYAEAEATLTGEIIPKSKGVNEDDILSEYGEQACFVFKMLAVIALKTRRIGHSTDFYIKSLKANPFLWDSFEQLCNLGHSPDPVETFSVAKMDNFSSCHGVNPVVNYVNNTLTEHSYALNNSSSQNNIDAIYKNCSSPVQLMNVANSGTCAVRLFHTPEDGSLGITTLSPHPCLKIKKNTRFRTMLSPLQIPRFGLLPFNIDTTSPNESQSVLTPDIYDSKSKRVHAKEMKETPLQQGKAVFSQSGNTSNTANIVSSNQANTVTPPMPSMPTLPGVRRSTRLFSSSCSVKENNKSPKHAKFVSPKSPSRKTKRGVSKANLNMANYDINVNNEKNLNNLSTLSTLSTLSSEKSIPMEVLPNEKPAVSVAVQALQIQKEAAEGLMFLLRDIGTAYINLSKFECTKAIEQFNNLSPAQKNTGWVLAMTAKAYFELPDYPNSIKYFRMMREVDPERLLYTEIYSSALWFLQREIELSALSQDLVNQARHCPQAWCSTANCFSLHKEHETAIKFLHRAVQVDPNFSYAYTLLGHEYLATEELDKAMSCFRSAVRISHRDYSALFGLGSVYTKQEKYELAQAHFHMAESINPKNEIVLCHIGVVQNAQKKVESALTWLGRALAINPKSPLGKFHRAKIYFTMGRHIEALRELEELKQIVPKESQVYYLIGKIYKKLGNSHLSLMHFSWAMDLDPKGTHTQVKEFSDPSLLRSPGEDDSTPDVETEANELPALLEANNAGQQQAPAADPEPESDESF